MLSKIVAQGLEGDEFDGLEGCYLTTTIRLSEIDLCCMALRVGLRDFWSSPSPVRLMVQR